MTVERNSSATMPQRIRWAVREMRGLPLAVMGLADVVNFPWGNGKLEGVVVPRAGDGAPGGVGDRKVVPIRHVQADGGAGDSIAIDERGFAVRVDGVDASDYCGAALLGD